MQPETFSRLLSKLRAAGVNKKVADAEPDVVAFLGKFYMSSANVESALAHMDMTGDDAEHIAMWWLDNNEDVWSQWVSAAQAAKVKDAIAGMM